MSFQLRTIIINVLAIVAMKLINQLTTFQYSLFNCNAYEVVNASCHMRSPNDTITDNPIMHIYKTGYILCAFGGLLANKPLDFRTVLGIGGGLMTLGVGLMSVSYTFGAICNHVLYAFIWILHPLYMGLLIPCLYFGFIRWASGPKGRTILLVLYYLAAGSTIWLGMELHGIVIADKYNHSYEILALIGLLLSAAFTVMCAMLSPNHAANFDPPTKRRAFRYVLIITTFTLYIVQLGDGHIGSYQKEVLLFYNKTSPVLNQPPLLTLKTNMFFLRLINQAGYYATAIALIFISSVHRFRFVPSELRILSGVGMAAVVALVCLIANTVFAAFSTPNPTLTITVFASAAFLDGVSEILTMISAYEFIDEITPRSHKLLTIGIMFSVWTLASLLRFFIQLIILDNSLPAELLKYRVRHAVDLVLLICCFLYAKFLSIPLSFTLKENQPEVEVPLLAAVEETDKPNFDNLDFEPTY